jgi:hypothetical protein
MIHTVTNVSVFVRFSCAADYQSVDDEIDSLLKSLNYPDQYQHVTEMDNQLQPKDQITIPILKVIRKFH